MQQLSTNSKPETLNYIGGHNYCVDLLMFLRNMFSVMYCELFKVKAGLLMNCIELLLSQPVPEQVAAETKMQYTCNLPQRIEVE